MCEVMSTPPLLCVCVSVCACMCVCLGEIQKVWGEKPSEDLPVRQQLSSLVSESGH